MSNIEYTNQVQQCLKTINYVKYRTHKSFTAMPENTYEIWNISSHEGGMIKPGNNRYNCHEFRT